MRGKDDFVTREAFNSEVGEVFYLNAPKKWFICSLHLTIVQLSKKDEKIGDIVDPLTGTIHATLFAPNDGILFTLREYPVVYEGSLIARIFGDNSGKKLKF